jgi:hypothetical protein
MSKLAGFNWDKKRKVLHLSCDVKGSGGKVRRERTLKLESIEEAREEWRKFREEISRVGPTPDATFKQFIDAKLTRICATVRASTEEWYRGIVNARVLPRFGEQPLSAVTKAAV